MTAAPIGAAAGFVELVALSAVLGGGLLEGLRGTPRFESGRRLWLLAAALVAALAGVIEITVRAAELADLAAQGTPWWGLVTGTRLGRVWIAREGATVLVVLALVPSRPSWLPAAALSGLAIALAPLASHSAGLDPAMLSIAVHVIHRVSAAAWLGILIGLVAEARAASSGSALELAKRFSRFAPVLVGIAVVSGVLLARWHIASWPRLLATPYGGILVAKLVFIAAAFAAAAILRQRLAAGPSLLSSSELSSRLACEIAFAGTATLAAVMLGSTLPAAHAVVEWWLPFRLSAQATWREPGVEARVFAGVAAAIVYSAAALGLARRELGKAALVLVAGLALGGAIAVPALAIPAFPGTYWSSEVPYHAVSVANGRRLYVEQCASCHGLAGRGDGPLAPELPKPPANLTEPHTADHTAGDMFWWLTYGIPAVRMPPFADVLSEEDRWDVINYLRALSVGYQARLLSPRISPGRPWLASIDFNYETRSGESGLLRDFREHAAVLIVLFTPTVSAPRLAKLADLEPTLREHGAEILGVPAAAGEVGRAPSRVVSQEAAEIIEAYRLFRRTFEDPGDDGDADRPPHLELLVDRFGYVRARWRPDLDAVGWNDPAALLAELDLLRTEPPLLSPPDDHVH